MAKLLLLFVGILAILSYKFSQVFQEGPVPDIGDVYWGPAGLQAELEKRTEIRPFKIKVDDKTLEDLKTRLQREVETFSKLPAPLEGTSFEYGFNSRALEPILKYWTIKYDWRKREELLNKWPQFKTVINGLDIHFQHIKPMANPKYKKTLPLLMVHGWPGSFVEFQKVIPMLTEPKDSDINFELVIPSLPGYGFSEAPVRPGLGTAHIGQIFAKLMERLGHKRFYVEGGDWGSLVVLHMSMMYPDRVLAAHSNACFSMHPGATIRSLIASAAPSMVLGEEGQKRFKQLSDFFKFIMRETGYMHIQATKPDTVGVGLLNSPSGLAAYILEKFATWTDDKLQHLPDGGLSQYFSQDELLDNLMVYWVTNSITTSMRLYSINFSPAYMGLGFDSATSKVPYGCVHGGNDAFLNLPDPYLIKDTYKNIVSYTYLPTGGHFLAFEQPELFSKDVVQFMKKVVID